MYFRRYDLGGKNSVDATASAHSEKKKPITNADRIRAMTDEELARWLSDMHDTVTCPNYGDYDCNPSCRICWLDWLQTAIGEEDELV